ncbi:CMP-sialic acid transporter 5 [Prunus yedoensis var. nudiflora]|uniref:CMP-sialic acid transporter 5 n=1 Tax=Prunus yedoensis var. nudiflora TaxID=2094558 RepID=A0A314UG92_PRUYE|nr:CMP-sialic acid transporter 5 [Prunus yedoensis var. nudiflora]
MAATKHKAPAWSLDKMNSRIWLFSLLLTLQYGAQPLISKRCTRREVIVTSSVLTCEIAKISYLTMYELKWDVPRYGTFMPQLSCGVI